MKASGKPGGKPLRVPRSQHNVSRRNIDDDALKVLRRLNRFDHTAYLVGGGVRDLLLERVPKDYDIGTTARPNQIKKLFRNAFLIGRRFRLAHIRFGQKIIECSTFRCEPEPVDATNEEEASLYQHHDNTYGTPEEDAWRRDFTVNGLFYDVSSFEVIDYVGGLKDLKKRVIRCIGDADIRFQEDPVRMLRAIRFAARLGFTIHRRTWKALLRHREEILKASPSRLSEEILKLFTHGAGTDAMALLDKSGLLDILLPWIHEYLATATDKGKLFWRCLEALDHNEETGTTPSASLIFAALSYPAFQECLQSHRHEGQRTASLDVAQEILKEIDGHLTLPRWMFYNVAHILDAQRRFEDWQKGRFSKKRFVNRKEFREAAIFFDIQRAARGLEVPAKKPWLDLYRESGASERAEEETQRPRRRRRRRTRKPRTAESSRQTKDR